MKTIRCLLLSVAAALLALRCTGMGDVAGGTSTGSETTNGIVACIRNTDGSPAAGARISLLPARYLAPPLPQAPGAEADRITAIADSAGYFFFGSLDTGDYAIEADDTRGNNCLLRCRLTGRSDTADLGNRRLRPYASLSGFLDTAGTAGRRRYVQVYGLSRVAAVDPAGAFSFTDLPEGELDLRAAATDSSARAPRTYARVRVIAGSSARFSSLLPAPWQSVSVGNETPPGCAYMLDDRFFVEGGGPDVFWERDDFHFVYRLLAGNGAITARLRQFTGAFSWRTNAPKAGLMFRKSLDPGSSNVSLSYDPRTGGEVMHWRPADNDSSLNSATGITGGPPFWIRLERTDSLFTGSVSVDGIEWHTVDSVVCPMGDTAYAGLSVTSGDTTLTAGAVFDAVGVR